MSLNKIRWQNSPEISPESENALHGYPPILRQILFNKGYATHEEAQVFLEGQKPAGTNPDQLLGMDIAVSRIYSAINHQESIYIYGDYDADGVTGTTLLYLYLKSLHDKVAAYIPNRFDEGYGLNTHAIKTIKDKGANLVITVDCGIRSLEEAAYARRIGLDLIISDHHHPGDELPMAIAVINPKQPHDPYPHKDLAGVGVAYKIIEALSKNSKDISPKPEDFLDLVAIGTVADLVPLVDENRYLVREGLKYIRNPQRQGIKSLMGVSGIKSNKLTATDIGFSLGPRINAAGRLGSAMEAFELLTAPNVQTAGRLAQILENKNRLRQQKTKEIQEKAEYLALSKDPQALVLFAVQEDFNQGVAGLAASRLTERYYRPSIVGEKGEEFTKASCRSISDFHITKALDQCSDLLKYYGGHAAAAGFTVSNNNLVELEDRLKTLAAEQLSGINLQPTIIADKEIPLTDLDPKLIEYLDWLQPTGYGNTTPIFCSRNLQVKHNRTVGKDHSHLKLTVSDGWISFDAIAFRQGHWQKQMPDRIDIMYEFEKNEFMNIEKLQLNIKDLKPTGSEP
jgi:single-stranded-DNA-specific exonuclease